MIGIRLGATLATACALWLPASDEANAARKRPSAAASQSMASVVAPALDPALRGPALDPAWPKHVYVITDSVMLGAKPNFLRGMAGWQITFAGRPALMIRKALDDVRQQRSVGPVAVVALGYNSIWQKNRQGFQRWADKFDKDVEDMLAALKERGARKIVWVTLRELTPDLIPGKGVSLSQYHKYAWYFPYVNERLKAIKARHPEMALADWATAAQQAGVTYDAIHLNSHGSELMVSVVKATIGIDMPSANRAGAEQPRPRFAEVKNQAQPPVPVPAPLQTQTEAPVPAELQTPATPEVQADVPRKKPTYRMRRVGMFALSKLESASVVMLGDSLTERAQWAEITGCRFLANRGIGGDQSGGVLRRLDDVTKLKPAAVFLMIGINDIASSVPTEKIADNVRQTIEQLTAAGAHVYLALALPVTHRYARKYNAKVADLNAAYKTLATPGRVSLIDLGSRMQTDAGDLRDEMAVDGIHLTTQGYRVWRDVIAPLVLKHCSAPQAPDAQARPARPDRSALDDVPTGTVARLP